MGSVKVIYSLSKQNFGKMKSSDQIRIKSIIQLNPIIKKYHIYWMMIKVNKAV